MSETIEPDDPTEDLSDQNIDTDVERVSVQCVENVRTMDHSKSLSRALINIALFVLEIRFRESHEDNQSENHPKQRNERVVCHSKSFFVLQSYLKLVID